MNFLAHCYLSCSDEETLIGNIITDFTNKKEADSYIGGIQKGIILHRKIDAYTDKHEASLELRAMLRPRHGKYASVVVDLVWDYFLCQNWSRYSGETLDEFVNTLYPVLSMIEDDFLLAYKNENRMLRSLEWMDNRVKYPSNFIGAINDIKENKAEIQLLFLRFFQDLIDYVDSECGC